MASKKSIVRVNETENDGSSERKDGDETSTEKGSASQQAHSIITLAEAGRDRVAQEMPISGENGSLGSESGHLELDAGDFGGRAESVGSIPNEAEVESEESKLCEIAVDHDTDEHTVISVLESSNTSLISHLDDLMSANDPEDDSDSEILDDGYYSPSSDEDSRLFKKVRSPRSLVSGITGSCSAAKSTIQAPEARRGSLDRVDEFAEISKIESSNLSELSCLDDLMSASDSGDDSGSDIFDDEAKSKTEPKTISNRVDAHQRCAADEPSEMRSTVLAELALNEEDQVMNKVPSNDSSILSHLEEIVSLASDTDDDSGSEIIDDGYYSSEGELSLDASNSLDDSSMLSHLDYLCSSDASSVNSCSDSLDDYDYFFESDGEEDNNHKPRVPSLNVMGREY